MSVSKLVGIVLLTGLIGLCGFELGTWLSSTGGRSFVPNAEAIIGRPLTPVSVAGVGRRTVRRCRRGVYHC